MKVIQPIDSKPLIVIPSHNRAGQVRVLECIPTELLGSVYIVVTPDQQAAYEKVYPDVNILVCGADVKCIAQKRQACIDLLPKGKVIMLDDKIVLYRKRFEFQENGMPKIPSGDDRYMDRTNNEFMDLYHELETRLDEYPQVGISAREGNSMREGFGKEIQKVYGAQGMRTDIFCDEGIGFDNMFKIDPVCILYEDYYVTLALLQKGYKNYGLYDYVYNHVHNAKGGNSGTRNHDNQERSVRLLQATFGQEYIKIWQYAGKSQWKDLENRWEVQRIGWSKLYHDAVQKLNEELNPITSIFDIMA
jgi:hypothetical protein